MARREREKKKEAAEKKNEERFARFFLVAPTDGKKRPTAPKKERRFPLASCRLSASRLDRACTKTTTDLCLARGTVRKANRPTKSDAGGAGGSGGGGVGTYP
jgi:hypothetical protein